MTQAKEILEVATKELKGLKDISGSAFESARTNLKGRLNRANACTATRLADRTKSLYYLGKTNEDLSS